MKCNQIRQRAKPQLKLFHLIPKYRCSQNRTMNNYSVILLLLLVFFSFLMIIIRVELSFVRCLLPFSALYGISKAKPEKKENIIINVNSIQYVNKLTHWQMNYNANKKSRYNRCIKLASTKCLCSVVCTSCWHLLKYS